MENYQANNTFSTSWLAKEVVSELVKKYPFDILKKINFELGNAIKTACDVSWETGGVDTKDSLKGQEQGLLQVSGGMHKHNTETSLEPGWFKPSHETCSGDQDGSMGEISSDLYRFVQCDIKKCAFDSLKLEQNPQNCD